MAMTAMADPKSIAADVAKKLPPQPFILM